MQTERPKAITLAITNYNRHEMLLDSYRQVIDDPRIDEVVIMDDCSDPAIYRAILNQSHPKLRITRQVQNRGMSRNKADAIALSKNKWCIIFDSDNIIDHRYLDAIPEWLFSDTFYLPSFAEPQFDYRQYAGLSFDRHNVGNFIDDPMFQCLLNTCNMLVNRDEYTHTYREDLQHKATDTIWMNYLWLLNGGKFYVMPDCAYFHRVHKGSGFLEGADYNMKKAEEVRQLIKQL